MNVVDASDWLEYFTEDENISLWTQDEHFKDIDGVKYVTKVSR